MKRFYSWGLVALLGLAWPQLTQAQIVGKSVPAFTTAAGTLIRPTLEQLQATYMAKMHDPVIFISAQERENIDELRALLVRKVGELHRQRYPNQPEYDTAE